MKIKASASLRDSTFGSEPLDENGSSCPLANRIICHDIDGTSYKVGDFIWPWTAFTAHKKQLLLHFYYWKQTAGPVTTFNEGITVEREGRMRELQFLMTLQIDHCSHLSATSMSMRLACVHQLARFAETRSCTVRDVLTKTSLLDAFGAHLPPHLLDQWIPWFKLLRQLDPETQLGFTLAIPKQWKQVERVNKQYHRNSRQHAPLPTRIYAILINNLARELSDVEQHMPLLLAALRETIDWYRKPHKSKEARRFSTELIERHGLAIFFQRHDYAKRLSSLGSLINEIFILCKIQIHVFSGMRDEEARHLPFHCMIEEKDLHGRTHFLICGVTTKLSSGRRVRTKWVTTNDDGFRAIRLAQAFASVIYESADLTPSKIENTKDNHPLFPSTRYLPWTANYHHTKSKGKIAVFGTDLCHTGHGKTLLSRLCPLINKEDIAELEEIDPFRAWQPEFSISQSWRLTTHQLRRSLALYANASGLVRVSSLRRQLQHITREMTYYYGRGSVYCKNFTDIDPSGYEKSMAVCWQGGADEAVTLSFLCNVVNSTDSLHGGAGNYFERQRNRGEIMSREDVERQKKAGLLFYREGPLGGCTRPGECLMQKGLDLINTACATDNCRYLIGKHSKIVQIIRLKRAAMRHVTPGSINEAMEQEELEALERVELDWRPQATDSNEDEDA